MTERPFRFPPSEALVATPPPLAAVEKGEEVVSGLGATGGLPLPAVEEKPVVLEEAVADVGWTQCEAAGEVLDAAVAVGVLYAVVDVRAVAAAAPEEGVFALPPLPRRPP